MLSGPSKRICHRFKMVMQTNTMSVVWKIPTRFDFTIPFLRFLATLLSLKKYSFIAVILQPYSPRIKNEIMKFAQTENRAMASIAIESDNSDRNNLEKAYSIHQKRPMLARMIEIRLDSMKENNENVSSFSFAILKMDFCVDAAFFSSSDILSFALQYCPNFKIWGMMNAPMKMTVATIIHKM